MYDDDDAFIDYVMFSELDKKRKKPSASGAGCCCMPVLAIVGMILLIMTLI